MKTQKTTLAALLFLLGLGLITGPQMLVSQAYADEDEGIVIEDEGGMDSSSISEESVEGDSESYPAGDSDD